MEDIGWVEWKYGDNCCWSYEMYIWIEDPTVMVNAEYIKYELSNKTCDVIYQFLAIVSSLKLFCVIHCSVVVTYVMSFVMVQNYWYIVILYAGVYISGQRRWENSIVGWFVYCLLMSSSTVFILSSWSRTRCRFGAQIFGLSLAPSDNITVKCCGPVNCREGIVQLCQILCGT